MFVQLFLLGSVIHSGVKAYKKYKTPLSDTNIDDSSLNSKSEQTQITDLHHQQIAQISTSSAQNEIAEIDKENHRYLSISTLGLGLTSAGALFFPLLTSLSVPVLIYVSLPIFEEAYMGVFKQRKLNAAVIDSVAVVGGIVTHYYFVSALSNVIYYSAKGLLNKTRDNTKKNLIDVFSEQPQSVWLLEKGIEVEVPLNSLKFGDIIVVNAGEIIPIDGVIAKGMATIDQHALTGESQPSEKAEGDGVLAATVILAGSIYIKVEKTGAESIAVQIGNILNNTAEFELSLQTQGEQFADKTVLPTLATGSLALVTHGAYSAVAILSSNFSEVIRLSSPFSMLNFLNIAAKNNILIKDGRSLELLNKVDTVVFDKTGTLTLDQPHVEQIYTCNGFAKEELLGYAAAAEYRQKHPIAKAILLAAEQLEIPTIDEAQYEIGYGIKVKVDNKLVRVGSMRFMEMEKITISEEIHTLQNQSHLQGRSTVFVAIDRQLGGVIELSPTIRPEAKQVIQQLKQRHLSLYIISGDHENPTRQLAEELGIDNYFADTLPQDKAKLIEQLQAEGKSVCFVGDGINDSIALKMANVSISLRGASTAATDIAQIILMDQTIQQLDFLFQLGQEFKSNINIGLTGTAASAAFCMGGVFFLHFGIPASFMIYNIAAISGITNASIPLLKHKDNNL